MSRAKLNPEWLLHPGDDMAYESWAANLLPKYMKLMPALPSQSISGVVLIIAAPGMYDVK